VRARDGGEIALPSWEAAMAEDWLGKWALNLMLINVSTRKFGRAVRLPEGDVAAPKGAGLSKSAASRRFVALSAERMKEWMASDLSELDLLVIQIDGIHIVEDLVLLGAVGVDGAGGKHPLAVIEGATENAAVVQALLDNLIERGLDPKVCRLFIIDGAKALTKAIRKTFGRHTPIQRCQVHSLTPHQQPDRLGSGCYLWHCLSNGGISASGSPRRPINHRFGCDPPIDGRDARLLRARCRGMPALSAPDPALAADRPVSPVRDRPARLGCATSPASRDSRDRRRPARTSAAAYPSPLCHRSHPTPVFAPIEGRGDGETIAPVARVRRCNSRG
jgi:Transposase, Mutator family